MKFDILTVFLVYYLASLNFLFNSSLFIFTKSVLLDSIILVIHSYFYYFLW